MARKVDVQRATTLSPAELNEAAAMLAGTFYEHPYLTALFPRAAIRMRAAHAMFAGSLKDGVRFGMVTIARDANGKIAGLTIIYPPGAYPLSPARMLRLLPYMLRVAVLSPGGLMRIMRTKATLEKLLPKEPHLYGFLIGVDLGKRSGGFGGALLKAGVEEGDRRGLPIYFETQKHSVLDWACGAGFKVLREGIAMFPGGPLTWTLWREPVHRARADGPPGA
jgi:hypothetical protein